jgi:DNA-binding Xre family transcriptional regulator
VAQKRLANQLAAFLRKRRGDLTYQQFARKTGLSDSTLHRLELGEQNITLDTLEQLCDRLKCSISEIFGE